MKKEEENKCTICLYATTRRIRNTEGSGLGLSVAKSLTELQGGKFGAATDADLFKVTLTFPVL